MSEEIATILERAADRLSKPGAWTQGGSGETDIACCAMWAIRDAGDSGSDADHFFRRFMNPAGNFSIINWNDAPDRTQEEVVAAVRAAAAKARAAQ